MLKDLRTVYVPYDMRIINFSFADCATLSIVLGHWIDSFRFPSLRESREIFDPYLRGQASQLPVQPWGSLKKSG